MRPPRNPFRLRTAEQIDDDWTFLSLYEPGLLSVLPEEGLWDRRVVIRSSAGGGKTTLLRLFAPGALKLLHSQGLAKDDMVREVYKELSRRGALDRSGPLIAGAMLSLAGKYAPLEHLRSIDEGQRMRIFLALLNVRVLLAALRAHLELANLRYPNDLARVAVKRPADATTTINPVLPASGEEIFDWARDIETQVASTLSSLGGADNAALPGDDELSCLSILAQGNIEIDGVTVAPRTVVLLDDVHRLSPSQRFFLLDTLVAQRSSTPVWISERLEALAPDELLSLGMRDDRDTVTVDIEQHWRGTRRASFQRLALGAADRRTILAPDAPARSFSSMLRGPDEQAYVGIMEDVERRLLQSSEGRREFAHWIDARVEQSGNARDRAIALRALEITIERELANTQMSMDVFIRDEAALDELDGKKEASNVREAAELFLCQTYKIPYYYGPDRLAQISSTNVEQFLEVAGDLFEELSGASILRRAAVLTPARQEQLVQTAIKRIWNGLSTGVENGSRVRSLLDGMGEYARTRTFLPNAPYAPGVTGVALRRSHVEELQAALIELPDSPGAELATNLSTLIAHNLVTVQASEAKGQRWAVYYLNRGLCVRYGLPLAYGGWQPVTPDVLYTWSRGDRVRSGQSRMVA